MAKKASKASKSNSDDTPVQSPRDKLIARLAEISRNSDTEMPVGQTGILNGDAVDVAFGLSELEVSAYLAERGSHEAAQISRALQRLDSGRYGVCEICECNIPPGRLEILPYCTTCVGCQGKLDAAY